MKCKKASLFRLAFLFERGGSHLLHNVAQVPSALRLRCVSKQGFGT
jgi:hypothetical protein